MKCSAILSAFVLGTVVSAAPNFQSAFEYDGVKSLKQHRGGNRGDDRGDDRGGNSIIDRLREDKKFSRFVEVLEREKGLRDDLENADKETTVLAPNNDAFKHLEDQMEAAGRGGEMPEWRDILRYHIATDSMITGDCLHGGALIPTSLRMKSLNDRHQRIRVFRFNDEVWFNMQSRAVHKDIKAENGVIHMIDRVLFPPQSVTEMINIIPTTFSTFSLALERTDMSNEINREKGVTVFAPSNQAWENLGMENLKYLFSCVGQQHTGGSRSGFGWDLERLFSSDERRPNCQGLKDLRRIIKNHIATDLAWSTDLMQRETTKLRTLGNQKLTICAKKKQGGSARRGNRDRDDKNRDRDDKNRDRDDEDRDRDDEHRDVRKYNFVINDGEARISFTDMLACNGAVQVTDAVIVGDVKLPHSNFN